MPTSIEAKFSTLQEQINALYQQAPFATHTVDSKGFYSDINTVELSWLGCRRDELIGLKKPTDFLTPESRIRLEERLRHSDFLGFRDLELDLVGIHGEPRPISMGVSNLLSHGGEDMPSYRAICFDISAKKQAEEWNWVAMRALDPSAAVAIINPEGLIQASNTAFTQLSGYNCNELRGKPLAFLNSGYQSNSLYESILLSLSEKGTWQGELFHSRKDRSVYSVWTIFSVVKSEKKNVVFYVGCFMEISSSNGLIDKLDWLANYDDLTNLPTQRLLLNRLKYYLGLAQEKGLCGALLFLNLEDFKAINDSWGHSVGDMLLREVAARLTPFIHEGDIAARFSGDEFVVILNDLAPDLTSAATRAQVLGQEMFDLLSQPYKINNLEHVCKPCIGIRTFDGSESPSDLIVQADLAMYHAKRGEHGGIMFFNFGIKELRVSRTDIEPDLINAIKLNQFQLDLQPIFNLSRQIVGAEALLRWNHPQQGILSPSEFIHLAEKNGLIGPIGKWVMQTACRQLKLWEADPWTSNLQLAINASAREFVLGNFVETTREIIVQHAINPALLTIELTESLIISTDQIRKTIIPLRNLGVKLSLDDFGTGYSSLSLLSQLPLNQLKIERSFVAKIGNLKAVNSIILMIIGMANSLGLEILAEGVETEAQLDFLKSCGCKLFQGYLFSSPVSQEKFASLLLNNASRFTEPH